MTFDVLIDKRAAKELEKLEISIKNRIKEELRGLREDPKKGKVMRPSAYRSLRAGDYRAIYAIDWKENRIRILWIGHRKEVYDDFSRFLK
jgi:mRNA-degrading endonuclease RelE of RelBE toxin-antitoxin system